MNLWSSADSTVVPGGSPPASTLVAIAASLIERMESNRAQEMDIIPWSCPVPIFGEVTRSRVATLGINPSNREFMDQTGKQLSGESRRFHTLDSLGIAGWAQVDARHLELIIDTYASYFQSKPYDRWFKRLEFAVSGAQVSYYDSQSSACHLDLVPFATSRRWSELSTRQQSSLLALAGDTLGLMLRDSGIRILILNGTSVVQAFMSISGLSLRPEEMPGWSLERRTGRRVMGAAYSGMAEIVSGIRLEHPLKVLGFSHNLQSSFGMTTDVISSIRDWITLSIGEEGW